MSRLLSFGAALLLIPLSAAAQAVSTAPAPGRALDLAEAYRLALARSEEIAISGATYEETLAKADEVLSNVLPRVSLMGSEALQDVPRGASGLFLQRQREQGWVSLHQPLFSGLREFLAYRASKDLGRAAELSLARAKQLLYRDTARAYLDLLAAQEDIRIRGALLEITRDRVQDLKEFRKVGRARASEYLAAESQAALQAAQLAGANAAEQVAQFKLGFLTGLEERLAPAPAPEPVPPPALEAALSRARTRPDVESRRAEVSSAELAIKVVSRRRWPAIALDANYYFQRPPSFTSDVKWDATITGSLPLYAGGEVGAQGRQQEARLRAKRAALSEAVRVAELEAKSAHRELLSSLSVTAALDNAARLAGENAKAQSEDYRLGQVTNLDVLGSLNALQQTRLQQNAARVDACWSRVRLEVAAGVPGGPL
ncbi:MAG: TolC family protein [Elusimicrobia bacterium]|nr:TolC family protein [Elusimicrobiota bacterium]